MIRLLATLHGARRVWPGPILRLLDAGESAFVVGMTGSGIVSAVANEPGFPGRIDGSIEVLELMAGGSNLPLVEAKAVRAVLDLASRERKPHVDPVDLLRWAEQYAGEARFGDLTSRRQLALRTAAIALLAVEALDEELAG